MDLPIVTLPVSGRCPCQSCPRSPRLCRLIHALEAASPVTDPAEAVKIVNASGISFADVAEHANFADETYRRTVVHESENVQILVLGWRPMQGSPIHDHAGSICVVKVLRGEAVETSFEMDVEGKPMPTGVSTQRTGDVFGSMDRDMHVVANIGSQELVTLHVYLPPLRKMNRWE